MTDESRAEEAITVSVPACVREIVARLIATEQHVQAIRWESRDEKSDNQDFFLRAKERRDALRDILRQLEA